MRNAVLIAKNVLRSVFKKKSSFMIYIVVPILCVLLSLALYSSSGNGTASVGIEDNDKSVVSEDLIKTMNLNQRFKTRSIEKSDVKSSILNQEIDCVLVIPDGFEDDVIKGNSKKLNLISTKGESVTSWINNYVNYYVQNLVDIGKASNGDKKAFDKMYSDLKDKDNSVSVKTVEDKYCGEATTQQGMGLFIMFILIGSTTTAGFILKEKENRTYYRTFCAPVNSSIYIFGNLIANIIIICIQVIAVIFFQRYILHIDTNMPDLELFIILMDFGLVSVAFGMLIVAFSKSRYQASSLSTLLITPTCMLSGCFWPLEMMPDAMQKVSKFFPQSWVIDAISKAQSNAAFSKIGVDLLIILAFAFVFFLIGIYKFRINDDVSNFA